MAEEVKDKHKEEPIIIKKKKGHGAHGAHGGAWKVAYADFVTAMMAFFIVMWILGQSEQMKKQIESFFKDPGAFNFITGKRAVPIDLNLVPEQGTGKGDGKHEFYFVVPPDKKSVQQGYTSEELKNAISDSIKASEKLSNMANELKKYIDKQITEKPELKEMLTSIKIEITKEGLRIELLESKESVFFEIGSSKVTQKAKDLLIQLAKEIGKLPNYVDIEGHTDSRQYGSGTGYSNWELSADRANSSRRLLEANGLWEGQVSRVTGYADRKLRTPDNPFDISNRRITILIRQLNTENFLKQDYQ